MRVLKIGDIAIMDMPDIMVDTKTMMKLILISMATMKRCTMTPDITGITCIFIYHCSYDVYTCVEGHGTVSVRI